MEKRGYDSACIRNVIARLFELNLLDDRRYARMWLQSRLHFTRSPKRLLASLCAKGIDRDDGEAVLKEVLCEETEFSLLIRYVKKHAKKTSEDPRLAGKNNGGVTRNVKFLLKSEGFSSAVIQKFLDEG